MSDIKISLKRLEDLGVIKEKLNRFFDDYQDLFNMCNSKHDLDDFLVHFNDNRNLEALHRDIRNMKESLYEIADIVHGDY